MLQMQQEEGSRRILSVCLADAEGPHLHGVRSAGQTRVRQVPQKERGGRVLPESLEATAGPHLQAVRRKGARPLAVRGLHRKSRYEFVLEVALD